MAPVYLDELPKSTIMIKMICGLNVRLNKYWYDYVDNVIIRKCDQRFDPKPYALIQGPKFQPVLAYQADIARRLVLSDTLEILAESYKNHMLRRIDQK